MNLTRVLLFFFFNDTATTEIYTLSLHDALPICLNIVELKLPRLRDRREDIPYLTAAFVRDTSERLQKPLLGLTPGADRKSTRLNSSHANISYAVFCLKKKKNHCSRCNATSMWSG